MIPPPILKLLADGTKERDGQPSCRLEPPPSHPAVNVSGCRRAARCRNAFISDNGRGQATKKPEGMRK